MISVVIPLYNKATTIERAIRSVLNQTYQDYELIVVNNGSTDGGQEIVKHIQDPRLRLVEQENQGVSMARNRGIAESTSDYIAFLDADDEWKPEFLETVLGMKDLYPDHTVFASAYRRCDSKGNITDIQLNRLPESSNRINSNGLKTLSLDNYFEVAALSEPPFCSISVMVRKEAIERIGGFPQGVHQGEDLLTWARLAVTGRIAYCTEPLSIFYTSEKSVMDRPKRIPADDDVVGRELAKIYNQKPLPYLDQYIAKWHKMRASIYLRLPHQANKCRDEIRQAQHWHRNNKMIIYTILSIVPYQLRMKVMKLYK